MGTRTPFVVKLAEEQRKKVETEKLPEARDFTGNKIVCAGVGIQHFSTLKSRYHILNLHQYKKHTYERMHFL